MYAAAKKRDIQEIFKKKYHYCPTKTHSYFK